MTPADRKAASERFLRERSIHTYEGLPLIEGDDEIRLRSPEEFLRRMIALWAVAGSAFLNGNDHFREYVTQRRIESWLSDGERSFLMRDARTERDIIQFTWRLEALFFLAWCAGLIESIDIPRTESSVEGIKHLFPAQMEEPAALRAAIRVREKGEIVGWADRLYRLHWAVRDAHLNGKPAPAGVVGGAVQEWHQVVNWVTNYESEDNWDHVGTDT